MVFVEYGVVGVIIQIIMVVTAMLQYMDLKILHNVYRDGHQTPVVVVDGDMIQDIFKFLVLVDGCQLLMVAVRVTAETWVDSEWFVFSGSKLKSTFYFKNGGKKTPPFFLSVGSIGSNSIT